MVVNSSRDPPLKTSLILQNHYSHSNEDRSALGTIIDLTTLSQHDPPVSDTKPTNYITSKISLILNPYQPHITNPVTYPSDLRHKFQSQQLTTANYKTAITKKVSTPSLSHSQVEMIDPPETITKI